jgi:hypothetical protein
MAFKISSLQYSSDFKTLIGVDLSAWTSAFAPSLLKRPASSFQFLSPPHTKHGPPGNLFIALGNAARAATRLFRQHGRQGRSRAKRIGGFSRGGPRGDGSFSGGGSFRGGGVLRESGLCGGNLSRLGGNVFAGRQDFRAAD